MSGHSKWHKIQHKKGKADKARSGMFTKLLKAITVAAQQGGGDPAMNFSLRLAVEKAKAGNVPKDNIEKAIKRGTGELAGEAIEEVLYEGYGPGGVALLVHCTTDNRNRTVAEVKHAFSKYGGSLGTAGSVQWQFVESSVLLLSTEKRNAVSDWEALELALIDAGADDVLIYDEYVEIRGAKEHFQNLLETLGRTGIEPDDSGLQWVPKDTITMSEEEVKKFDVLVENLEELDDVNEVFSDIKH